MMPRDIDAWTEHVLNSDRTININIAEIKITYDCKFFSEDEIQYRASLLRVMLEGLAMEKKTPNPKEG